MPPRDLDDQVVARRLTAIRELVDLLTRQGEVSGAQLRDDLVLRLAVERALSQLVDLDLVAGAVPLAASQFDEYVAQVKTWLQARA
ncbi:hypothetical protein [Arsenicicoccus bolidensis]|uniref:Uncharacterized protein n=1 Tax=Arsenicicoccus bolidensis TaxID=229480 RepID=A0ABS9Q1Q0_9MICO|nr:hypothetical protein [Arsenicicoccus bolidensis]MCG7321013.1 hypothetical protein [Arsenicicoccus bolidensis]